jgi:RNA polymerase sigma factor (sigma-70 family)
MSEHDGILLDRWETTGDQDAFMEVVARYQGMVYGACMRIVKDQTRAEDLVQECFLKLTKQRPRDTRALGPWLHRIATNTSLRLIDSEQRRKIRELKYVADAPSTTEATWDDVNQFLDEALNALPDNERAVIVARFLEGRTQSEAAEHLNISRTTVQIRIKKGLEHLQRSLKSRGAIVSAGALSIMLTSNLSHAAPATLASAMGKAVLSGVFNPQKAGIPAIAKLLAASAAIALIGISTFTYLNGDAKPNIEVLELSSAEAAIILPVTEPESVPVVLAAAQDTVDSERPPDAQTEIIAHAIVPTVSKADRMRLQCVDESGNPVGGATVYVFQNVPDFPPLYGGWGQKSSRHRRDGPFVSDDEGYIEFDSISQGKKPNRPNRAAYAVVQDRLIGVWDEGIEHGIGIGTSEPIIRMVSSVSVSGRVKLPLGSSFSSVRLEISALSVGQGLVDRSTIGNTFDEELVFDLLTVPLDSRGRFSIHNVPTKGSLTVRARGKGLGESTKSVRDADPATTLEIVVKPEGRIEGYVRHAKSGAPVVGRRVVCHSGGIFSNNTTNENGKYRIDGLDEGEYFVYVKMDAYPPSEIVFPENAVVVLSGRTTHGIDLVAVPGHVVRGKVIDKKTGEPLAGAIVTAKYRRPQVNVNTAFSNEQGMYEIQLPAGESQLNIKHPDYFLNHRFETVKVTENGTSDPVEIVSRFNSDDNPVFLDGMAKISGRVLNLLGRPIEGVLISNEIRPSTKPVQEKRSFIFPGQRRSKTNHEGRYSIKIPTAGDNQIVIGGIEWSVHRSDWYSLSKGDEVKIEDVQLTRYEEKLTVQLLDENGRPAPYVSFQLEAKNIYRPGQRLESDSRGMIHLDNLPKTEMVIKIRDKSYWHADWNGRPGQHIIINLKRKQKAPRPRPLPVRP